MITYEDEIRQEEKIEIIRNLIKLGLPPDFIKKATGFSEKKVLEIKEKPEKEYGMMALKWKGDILNKAHAA